MQFLESKDTVLLETPHEVKEAFFIPELWDFEAGDLDLCGGLIAGLNHRSNQWKRISISFANDALSNLWDSFTIGNQNIKSHLIADKNGCITQEIDGDCVSERNIENDVYFRIITKLFDKYKTLEVMAEHYEMSWHLNNGNAYYKMTNRKDLSEFRFYLQEDMILYINLIKNMYNKFNSINTSKFKLNQEAAFTI
jgi:hypothetical protein